MCKLLRNLEAIVFNKDFRKCLLKIKLLSVNVTKRIILGVQEAYSKGIRNCKLLLKFNNTLQEIIFFK